MEEKNVKRKGFWMVLAAAVMLWCAASAALAESARIVTPGGALNMRRSADEKSKLVDTIPNKTLVEVDEIGEIWTKITYKRKSGYVKTDFLKIPSQMVGKTVYADDGTLLLRLEAAADAAIIRPVSGLEPVEVISVEGEWAQVRHGAETGFVEVAALSYQLDAPAGSLEWIPQPGAVAAECDLLLSPDAASSVLAKLQPGQEVTVTVIQDKMCLVETDAGCGYVPNSAVTLAGAGDTDERTGSIAPLDAVGQAETILKKNFRTFAKEKLYATTEVYESPDDGGAAYYHCGFFNEIDQYMYGALVDAETGKAVFFASYHGFAMPLRAAALLPQGEIQVELSADSLFVGDVLDITVRAWTEYQCVYSLSRNGNQMVSGKDGAHFTASYRPRQAGNYRLTVNVKDQDGLSASATAEFSVEASPAGSSALSPVYSQKDGWWLDKAYRKSNMDHSGCAIFTLSHALQRMGHTETETLPENLAVTYALCLTPDGTNNERLITTAASDFGFQTKRQLFTSAQQIVTLLKGGALFSFSVARGHIALVSGVSEDGSMVRIVDSAPGATFERIVNVSLYYQMRSGSFRAVLSLDDIPGSRWYLDTEEYGGLEYWLPVSYAAKRGVRLIQPLEQ